MADTPSSLLAAARGLAAGRIDPVAVTEASLAAATVAGEAFITITAERARFEAGQARERWARGLPLGPLDGLPMTWKDLFDVKDTVTTAGSRTRAEVAKATADAPLVRRAAQAGMVLIGKTNLSEFAYSGLGLNAHFGTPAGVVGRDGARRVPGGSSSGAATATRLGAGLIGIGSDTAGSVRVPAAFQGLVGYRPSVGRYTLAGSFPLAHTFDTPGPLAHTVADVVLLDRVLRGETPTLDLEPAAVAPDLVVDGPLLDRADESVRANLLAAIETLARAGARVVTRDVAALRAAEAALQRGWLGAAEALALHDATLASPARALVDPRIVDRLERARQLTPQTVADLYRLRLDLVAQVRDEIGRALLVYPTVGHVAPRHDPLAQDPELFAQTNIASLRATMATSYLTMPGIAIPTGTDADGLPTSLLLSVPGGEDEALFAAALWVERRLRV